MNTGKKKDREKYTDLILDDNNQLKIILAGPGTGKTFTFKNI